MRPIESIELSPRSALRLRLRFEKAGEREVMVWVQQPRSGGSEHRH